VQEDLGKTLALIRDKGRAGFYEGVTSRSDIAEMKAGKGLNYQSRSAKLSLGLAQTGCWQL
jgi:gamma-glutamyltranspeptidase